MRKIDKTTQLSTEYRDWLNDLETRGEDHPNYNSSSGKYYKDIVMDLLRCQEGLCAYTEIQLCPPQYLTENNWENGRYKFLGRAHNGQLEHFDETLKWKDKSGYQHKDWLWENFFMIDSDTNNRKGDKTIDYILKPDSPTYDSFIFLDYSLLTHRYIANENLPDDQKDRVEKMIETLGLNYPNLVDIRKGIVERCKQYNILDERQFPTAFDFYDRNNG